MKKLLDYAIMISKDRSQIVRKSQSGFEKMRHLLELITLGGFQIRLGGAPLSGFESRKAQALLVYLAAEPRPHDRTELAGLLWSQYSPARARANLRRTLSNLRHLLPNHLRITRHAVAISTEGYSLDAADFAAKARRRDDVGALQEAVKLYRGDFLAGVYLCNTAAFEEWALLSREQLRQIMLQTLYYLVNYHTAYGEHDQGISYATQLLAMDPWREETHRAMMRLLAMTGQRSAALAQYETCRRILKTELGLEPLEETTELYQRLLHWRREDWVASTAGTSASPPPLYGRGAEHAKLLGWWERARGGQGRLTLVAGEAGVGKTRLVDEIIHYAEMEGALVLRGRCYEFGNGVPYQPIAEAIRSVLGRSPPPSLTALTPTWLAELGRLTPEVRDRFPGLPPPQQVAGLAARTRLFEAVARLLRALNRPLPDRPPRPLLFLLDDLHWADAATLDLLHYLLRQLHADPIWFVGAYRTEETGPTHLLTRLRRHLSHDDLVDLLELAPISAAAVAEITRFFLQDEATAELQTYLFAESEGNPFILIETIRSLQEQEALTSDPNGRPAMKVPTDVYLLPGKVQDMILQRVDRLNPTARRLLTLAAVIGRHFDDDLLRTAAGEADAPQVAASMAEWRRRHLVRAETTLPGQYDFSHDKIRSVVYHAAGTQQPHFHRRVGEALESLYAQQRDAVCEQLAYHFEKAGMAERALVYLPQAAAKAAAVYAYGEALDYLDRALALLEKGGERRWEILLQRAQVLRFLSRFDEAIADCEQVLAAASGHPNGELLAARAAVELSALHRIRRDYDRAWAWGEHGSRLLRTPDEHGTPEQLKELARAREELGKIEQERGNLESAQRLLEEALALYRKQGHPRGVAGSLIGLGRIHLDQGRNDAALQNLNEALAIFRDLGDRRGEADCLAIIGHAHWEQGHFDRAQRAFDESLIICRAIGDRRGQARCLGDLGLVHLANENDDQAQQNWEESVALYRALGLEKRTAAVLRWLGILGELRGDYVSAQTHLQESLAIDGATGARMEEMLDRAWLGRALLERGEYEDARHYLQTALALNEAFAHSEDVSFFLIWLAGVAFESGKLDEARDLLQKARAQQGSEGMPWGAYEAAWQATIELALDEKEAALATARQALADAEAGGKRRERGIAHALMGMALGSLGPDAGEDPRPHFEQALTLLREWPFAHGQALRRYGTYLLNSGDRERGRGYLQEARAIFQRLGARGELEKTSRLLAGAPSSQPRR